jgi:glutamyl-tRNA reductase
MSRPEVSRKELVAVGTSHRRAGIELRERLCLTAPRAAQLARTLAEDGEAAVLSTCNRTEVYLAHPDAGSVSARAHRELAKLTGVAEAELAPTLYTLQGEDAARHLCRVAAGLDSLVRGETQILGQVRAAYKDAQAAGGTGVILNCLFRRALRAGRRVRAETRIQELAPSVPRAAAELARRVVGELEGRRILLIGAGKMSQLAAASLVGQGADNVFVANHTLERAEQLAARFGGEAVGFDGIPGELERADLVVSSTRCPQAILSAEQVAPALRRREGRPLVFIDIAVPRDLDPGIGGLEGARLYDIDDLGDDDGEGLVEGREEVLAAEAIAADEAARFREWQLALDVRAEIAALRDRAEEIRVGEVTRAESRLRALSPREREAVDAVTAQIVNKLLHAPTVRMKQAATEGEAQQYADALRYLFALGDRET